MVTQGTTAALKLRIQRVQNSCIRYIFGIRKYDHISSYLKKQDTLKIEGRTQSHALTMMHKIVNKTAPSYLTDKVSYRLDIHGHDTRNRMLLTLDGYTQQKKLKHFLSKQSKITTL